LAGSSAAALAEQRKKKEFEQKLPYERDLKLLPLAISANQNEQEKLWDLKLAGMKTGSTSELAKAEANLARAEASRDPEQIARAKAEVGRIATQISDADAARETSQQGTRGTIYAPVWKDINKRYQALSDETGLAQNYARKMQIAADLAEKYGSSGAFGETRLELGKISEFLSESFGLSREVATAFQEKLNLPAGEEISYGELLKSVGAQGTLLFTQLIPGNLNQSEVDLVSAVGANLFTTKEGAALIRDLSARGARRAQQLEQGLLKTRDEWLAANGRDLASTKANPMLFQTIMQQTERDIKASWEVEATVEEQDKVHLENILAPQVETLMGDLDDPNYWESQARKKGKGNENIESLFSAANVPRGSTDEAEIIRNASENMWNGLLASKLGKASPEIQKRVIVGMLESFYKAESRLPVVVGKRFGEILSGVLEIMGGRKTRTGSEPFTPGAGG